MKKAKSTTTQGRLDSFFKVTLSPTKKRKVSNAKKRKGLGGCMTFVSRELSWQLMNTYLYSTVQMSGNASVI